MQISQSGQHIGWIRYLDVPNRVDRRRLWSEQELKPYIIHSKAKRYFDSLLFEACCGTDGSLLSPRLLGMTLPANKAGWQQAARELYQPWANLAAALRLSKRLSKRCRLHIWIALPYPPDRQREPFGTIDGETIVFNDGWRSRLKALKWWVDTIIHRWHTIQTAIPNNRGQLQGFVWMKNSHDMNDERVISELAQHIHHRSLALMWCQNYGTSKVNEGYSLGFDHVIVRPTYAGTKQRDQQWIKCAIRWCAAQRFGIVIWEPTGRRNHFHLWLSSTRKRLKQAMHVYEWGDDQIGRWRCNHDPRYERLYQYMREKR